MVFLEVVKQFACKVLMLIKLFFKLTRLFIEGKE